MAKKITLTHDGIEYTLEYTRSTATEMEDIGFSLANVRQKPVTFIPILFSGAFLAHHRHVPKTQGLLDKIYKGLPDKQGLVKALIEMYGDTMDTLFDEPEPSEKNAQWEANF